MIDFSNDRTIKLKPMDLAQGQEAVAMLLLEGESVGAAFKGARDMIMFTGIRIIVVNVQGLAGKKTDYSSLPYRNIQAFSVETAGALDRDAELEIWMSGLGKVKLEFGKDVDIHAIGRWIGQKVLVDE